MPDEKDNPFDNIIDSIDDQKQFVQVIQNPSFRDLDDWEPIDMDIGEEKLEYSIFADGEVVVVRETWKNTQQEVNYRLDRDGLRAVFKWMLGHLSDSETKEMFGENWEAVLMLTKIERILNDQPTPDVNDEDMYYNP